jgi:hypothetical protein
MREDSIQYGERQSQWIAANCLEIGDKVKVIGRANDRERGWANTWSSGMNDFIGKEFTLEENFIGNGCFGIQLRNKNIIYEFP